MKIVYIYQIGKTHAKWSPVGTAFYRLMPDIKILKSMDSEQVEELAKLCPKSVFEKTKSKSNFN